MRLMVKLLSKESAEKLVASSIPHKIMPYGRLHATVKRSLLLAFVLLQYKQVLLL